MPMCVNGQGDEIKDAENITVDKIGMVVTLSMDTFLSPKVTVTEPNDYSIVESTVMISIENDTFSVEVVKNGKLESFGCDAIPIIIGFPDEQPLIGYEAIKIKETNISFVVYNMIKLLVADCTSVKVDPSWGFKMVENKDDKIFVVFDTFRGQRKATAQFLFSIIFKWAISKAENYMGHKAERIVIVNKALHGSLKPILENGFKAALIGTKLKFEDVQIHRYKVIEI